MVQRKVVVWAMALAGTVLTGIGLPGGPLHAGGQEPEASPSPGPPASPSPAPPGAEPGAEAPEDTVPGPTPGAPTVGLAQSVRMALEGNFGMLGQADSVESARYGESASRAQFYPQLTPRYQKGGDSSTLSVDASQKLPWSGASLSATGSLRHTTIDALDSRASDLRLTLSQPLLRGLGPNATYFDLRNARRARVAQERGYELARQQLAVEVSRAFYQVVKQRHLLEVARQSLKRSEKLRLASEARIKVGLASKLDMFRAELQASQAQEAMVSAQAALESALESFRFLLGLAPAEPLEPEGVRLPEKVEDTVEPLEVLVAQAFEQRLDLKETRDQVDDSRRSLSLQRQRLLPQLDLSVSFTQTGLGTTLADSLKPTDRRVDVFFSTSYPLERSSDKAAAAVAELDYAARQRTLRQRELQLTTEVRAAVRELERIRKSVELQKQGLEFAQQQHRLATLRYQRGLASNFDVVDAEGNLVSARTALVGLVTDYLVARVNLRRVTGTLDVDKEFAE